MKALDAAYGTMEALEIYGKSKTDPGKIYRLFHSERMNQAIGLGYCKLIDDRKNGGEGQYYLMEDGRKVHKFLDAATPLNHEAIKFLLEEFFDY